MHKLSNFFTILALLVSLLAPTGSVLAGSPEAPVADSEPICGSPTTVRLLSDQNINTGSITLSNSQTNLFVTYTTSANYKLVSAQVEAANTLAGIPKTNKGNPVPGQFAYQATLNKVSTYTFTIPLSGLNSTFVVAAHADVLKSGSTKLLGAWGEGTMFNPKNRSWGMYFNYVIKPCNQPPMAVNDSYSTVEDTPLNIPAPGVLGNDSDPDADPITAELVTSTAHGTLNLNADGSFVYSPDANYNGPDSFTYQVKDSFNNLSNTATVNVTVSPVNDAPAAVDDSYSVDENETLNTAAPGVLTNDVDVDGNTLTAILVSGPSHAASFSLSADGSFSYTPNNYFSGSDSFTYKASDGTLDSNIATVSISIDDVNFAPTANDDSYSTAEDTPLTIAAPGVVGNDTDPDLDPITAVKVGDPAHGSVTLNADGSFTYSPDANYNGSDSFTYKVNDGSLDSNVATVNITVDPVNDAPVANNDSYSTNEDTPLNITAPGVLNNDSDVENNTLNAVLVSDPAHGSLTLNADGSFTYTPDANYSGSDSFTYKANDGAADSNVATVSITVSPVNDAPVANNDSYSTDGAAALTVSGPGVLGNDTDADNDTLSAVLVSGPGNADAFSLNSDGSFSYTASAGATSDSFTYKANDGQADSSVATVTISINAAPIADAQNVSTNEDAAKVITLTGSDADDDNLSFSIAANPSHGTLGSIAAPDCSAANTCSATVTYTPDANYNGSDSFTFKVNDGFTDSTSAAVSITVDPVNDAPVAVDDSYSTDEDTPLIIPASGVLANDSDVDGNLLTGAVVTTAAHGSLALNANGGFTYNPDTNYTGSDSFTYQASDGVLTSNLATVTLTVGAVDDDPTAVSDSATVAEDAAATAIDVLANDLNADGGPISIDSVTQPANGTVVITGGGTGLTYQPNANYCNTPPGSTLDTFTYTLTPGGSTDTVSVTVTCVDDAPAAVDDTATVLEDAAATAIVVLANDTDVDGGPISVTSVTQPANGTVIIIGGGTGLTYAPNANYCNGGSPTDDFTYTLTPGGSSATVAVTVTCVDDAPTAVNDAATVPEDSAATTINALANDTDVDGGPAFSVASVTQPANGTVAITNAGADLTYQPNANYCNDGSPTDSFTYTLTPGGSTASVAVTVTCVNDVPSFTKGADQTVDEDSGAQTVNGWATAISAGPNESSQTVSFLVSNDNNSLFSVQPALSTAGVLTYTPAANQNGSATVTVQIQDNGGTANGGVDTSTAQTFTITVNAVNDAPVALAKAGSAHTNMSIALNLGLLSGVTDADSGINGCTPAFSVASITASTGGTVSNVNLAAGTFDFHPSPGFTGAAVVNYTVQDTGCPGTATSAPAAINITVSGPVIWFVNASVAGPGTGTLADPFKTLASADAVDAANHRIFLYAGTYANGVALNSGEWLIGQGVTGFASFDALMGITPPAGTVARPTLGAGGATVQSTVTIATNAIIKAITISTSGATQGLVGSGGITGVDVTQSSISTATGTALSLNNVGGTLSLSSVSANGAATGVDLTNVGATVTISSGTIQNTTTAGVSINGGTGNYTHNFSTLSNTSGRTILVQNRTAGTVAFTGTINGGGTGILLNSNTGSTINFASGTAMALSTGANAAFSATGGGTVNVAGNNSLTTTTGTALRVENTTIGPSGLTFRSISANGGTNGIVLSNTGSTAGLTVTGSGGTCTPANTAGCTGGTIQNMTGADDSSATPVGTGIVLNNVRSVSLTRMWIHDHSNYALRGTGVNGLTLDSSVVNGTNGGAVAASAGSPFNDSSIYFTNLTGSAAISNTSISGGFSNNVKLVNTAGTLDRLTLSAVTIGANSTAEGNDGIGIEGQGASVVKVTVQNSTFTSARGDLFQMNHIGTGTADLVFSGNALSNNHPGIATGGGGVTLGNGSTSTFTMNLSTNTFRDAVGHAVLIVKDVGTGSQSITFTGNTIGVAAAANSGSLEGSDLKIQHAGGGGTQTMLVNNNFFYQYNNDAVLLQTGAGLATSGTFNATVTGNTMSNAGNNPSIGLPIQGINLNGGVTPGDTFAICAQIGGASALRNDLDSAVGSFGGGDFRIRQRQSTTVRLPGYAGGATDTAAVVTFINGNNFISGTGTATVSSPPGGGFVGGAACPLP